MKKNLKRLVVFLIALIAVVPVISVSAAEQLQNVELAEDGTITWDNFTGVDNYKINDETPITVTNADIDDYIASPVSGEIYSIEIKGFDNGGTELASYSKDVLYRNGKWFLEFYSITYNTNGGSAITTEYFGSTQTPELTNTIPTKNGYVFDDWYLNTELTEYFAYASPLTENITVYAGWNKIINSINVNITRPKVGDKVTVSEVENQWGAWEEADKKPEVTFEDGAKYEAEWLAYIKSFPSEDPTDYDRLFSGVFEKDGWYYVEVSLLSKEGYAFDKDDNMTIKVNGETVNIEKSQHNSIYAGSHWYMFYAKIKATDGTEEEVGKETTEENNTSNPNTGDEILFYIGLLTISILGYASSRIYSKKKLYN